MQSSSLLGHSAELLRIIRKSPQPADLLTSSYMRDRKYIGAADRRAISALVFHAQRVMESADTVWHAVTAGHPDIAAFGISADAGCVCTALLLAPQWDATDAIEPFLDSMNESTRELSFSDRCDLVVTTYLREKLQRSEEESLHLIHAVRHHFSSIAALHDTASLAVQSCLPAWIVERWQRDRTADGIRALGRSFLHPAPLCLRVNTRIASRAEVMARLHDEEIPCSAGALSPHAILVHRRVNLSQHELVRSGAIEIQDEGSQMVGFACHPAPTDRILDACAGAGGKTLHLAVLQDDRGEILASDAEPKRMRELYARQRTANLTSIRIQSLQHLDDSARARMEGTFDIVLIDAPCSGLGTVRRSPMLKWRSSANAVHRLHERQHAIIADYARYVRPGGVLVYVTCSVMREENDEVVQAFLQIHSDFRPDPLLPSFRAFGCTALPCGDDDAMMHLDPLSSGTDGFFIARMKRSGSATASFTEAA